MIGNNLINIVDIDGVIRTYEILHTVSFEPYTNKYAVIKNIQTSEDCSEVFQCGDKTYIYEMFVNEDGDMSGLGIIEDRDIINAVMKASKQYINDEINENHKVYEIIDTISLSLDACKYVVLRDIPPCVESEIDISNSKKYICKLITDEEGNESLEPMQDINIAKEIMKKHEEFLGEK